MRLTTSGNPKKVDKKLCKKALHWYAKKLLGPRLYDKVTIHLEFTKEGMCNNLYNGFCDWNDKKFRGRDFTITINSGISKRDTLTTIAHEMVHVKQYAKGEMRDSYFIGGVSWQGKSVNTDKLEYWDTPWEIEAFGREKGLYLRFISEQKEAKK